MEKIIFRVFVMTRGSSLPYPVRRFVQRARLPRVLSRLTATVTKLANRFVIFYVTLGPA
jgi:hypothetical protein